MMANPYRGEVALNLAGRTLTLRLSLGALARLERELGASNLSDLIARLVSPNLPASQLRRVLVEALMAGSALSREEAGALLDEHGAPLVLTAAYIDLVRASFLTASVPEHAS
jgi:hypothetical protein